MRESLPQQLQQQRSEHEAGANRKSSTTSKNRNQHKSSSLLIPAFRALRGSLPTHACLHVQSCRLLSPPTDKGLPGISTHQECQIASFTVLYRLYASLARRNDVYVYDRKHGRRRTMTEYRRRFPSHQKAGKKHRKKKASEKRVRRRSWSHENARTNASS